MSNGIQKLSLKEKTFYGFGDLASNLFWQTITLYLLFFYTDVFGLTAVAAGTMIAISRILDAFFDVGIGMMADRTDTRWGKFRPYLLWGAIPLAVAAVFAFSTPDFGPTGKLVYAYVTFILFMFMYSFINIPYTSLLGVISGDPIERTSASSFKFIGAYIGCFIVASTALLFANKFGQGDVAKGWQITLAIYGVAAVILFWITFLSTRERIRPMDRERIHHDLRDLYHNLPWILLFIVTILFILFVCIRLSVTAHYFKYYIGEQVVPWLAQGTNFLIPGVNVLLGVINVPLSWFGKERELYQLLDLSHKFGFEVLASAFNTIGTVFAIVGVILVPWFAKLCGRKSAVVILFMAALICTGAFYFLKPEDLLAIFVFQTVGSLMGGPISALLWAMYADTADYSEWITARRATGLVFSASIMSNKLGWAIGSMIAGIILAATGFAANVAQNINVQNGLKAMMSIIPVAIGAVALIILAFFYKLDETTMKKIKEDLEERRGENGISITVGSARKEGRTCLDLVDKNLSSLPENICHITILRELFLAHNQLAKLPPAIKYLVSLKELYLFCNQLTELPPEIGNLKSLRELDLYQNQLSSLPVEIRNLKNLMQLDLSANKFTEFPTVIGHLTNLTWLDISRNQLAKLPAEIGNLTNLKELILYQNQLSSLPPEIGNLTNLKELYLHNNQLTKLPPEIENLKNLRELYLSRNKKLAVLPREIGKLTNLRVLYLFDTQITELPEEILELKNKGLLIYGPAKV